MWICIKVRKLLIIIYKFQINNAFKDVRHAKQFLYNSKISFERMNYLSNIF